MRTFIIRARRGTTRSSHVKSSVGTKEHMEVVAHTIMNAFFISNDFRKGVEVYVVLDSSADFPRTIKLSADEGLSIAGFHEEAVLDLIEQALREGAGLEKEGVKKIAPGLSIYGYGFEKLVKQMLVSRPVYLLDKKGEDVRATSLSLDPVFVLSDHLAMPKNSVKGLIRHGLQKISLGKKMLFASQCVVLIHDELDRRAS